MSALASVSIWPSSAQDDLVAHQDTGNTLFLRSPNFRLEAVMPQKHKQSNTYQKQNKTAEISYPNGVHNII